MTDLRARIADALWEAAVDRTSSVIERQVDALLSLPDIAIVERDRIDAALDRLSTQAAQCSSADHRDRIQAQVNEIRAALLAAAGKAEANK